jgi:hypothetical protein
MLACPLLHGSKGTPSVDVVRLHVAERGKDVCTGAWNIPDEWQRADVIDCGRYMLSETLLDVGADKFLWTLKPFIARHADAILDSLITGHRDAAKSI